jgi:hypothetical protein
MSNTSVHPYRSGSAWLRAAIGAVAILVLLVASDYAFVAHYSYLMMPGRDLAHYQEFARLTAPPFATLLAPWVSFVVASRVIAGVANPWAAAAVLLSVALGLDVLTVVAMGFTSELFAAPQLLGMFAKACGIAIAAALRGSGRVARTAPAPAPAGV